MTSLLNNLIRHIFYKRIKKAMEWLHRPHVYQEQILQYLVQTNTNTIWGKEHLFKTIKTPKDFAAQTPLQDYDSLKPYIQRTLNGEQMVLWHTPIYWFAKSSGTTSDKSKFLPLSSEAIHNCHIAASRDLMALYIHYNPQTTVYGGKTLIIGGSSEINRFNKTARYGDLSAVLLSHLPPVARYLRTPPSQIVLLPNWDEKLEKTAQLVVKQDITNFAGVPTWFLVLFKRVLEITGKTNLLQVWPNLQLYLHGGVSFTPYAEVFSHLIPSEKVQYWQNYNASEGFFAIQDMPNRNDMALLLNHGIYYEFLPMSELNSANPATLTLPEVELGKNYALVISTNAGLWRYMPGDTVMFTSLNPYRIRVTGRTRHYINAFGEELIIDNADAAIETACRLTHAQVQEYTAAPVYFSDTGNGAHEWLIEFSEPPQNLHEFVVHLDEALKQVNSDYEAKRFQDMAMRLPMVISVPKGTFYQWLKNKGKLGGQHKIPRLSNDRQLIDEIKQLM